MVWNEPHIPNQELILCRFAPNFFFQRARFEERPLTVLVKRSATATKRPSAQVDMMISSGMSVLLRSEDIKPTLGRIAR